MTRNEPLLAHKALHDQGLLHEDLRYISTFLFESPQGHIYEFLISSGPHLRILGGPRPRRETRTSHVYVSLCAHR